MTCFDFKNIFLVLILSPLSIYAQDYETTVQELSFKSTNKTVIDQSTIEKSKAPNITSLLQSYANIAVSSTSFQQNTLYLRGGDSSHILILVDGIPVFDPGSAQRTINLNTISLKSVRRIEVLRGPQTVLYGGQALAGVIKIETFGKELQNSRGVGLELGTSEYKQVHLFAEGKSEDNQGFLGRVNSTEKKQISPVSGSQQIYPQNNINADLAYTKRGSQDWVARIFRTDEKSFLTQANPPSYKTLDAQDLIFKTQLTGFVGSFQDKKSILKPEISVGSVYAERSFTWPVNASNVSDTNEYYSGQLTNIRALITVLETESLLWRWGGSYFKESLVFRDFGVESTNTYGEQKGIFTKIDYSFSENSELEVGGRMETVTQLSPEFTSQIGLTLAKNTKIEYATAFRSPSQFQFWGRYGNSNLKPERAISTTVTQEIPLNDRQSISIGVFEIIFSNLITAKGFPPKYQNINNARVQGAEFLYSSLLGEQSRGFFRYTYQEPKDLDTNDWLVRRPLNIAGAGVSLSHSIYDFGLEASYNSERSAQTGSKTTKSLAGYSLVNVHSTAHISDHLSVYLRANNLLDEKYEESYDYLVEGRFLTVGLIYDGF